jgi:hypothetical protein
VKEHKPEVWDVKFVPSIINLQSEGEFIAFIKIQDPYKIDDLVRDTIVCEGAPALRLVQDSEFPQVFGLIFHTGELQGVKPLNKVRFMVSGNIKLNGELIDFSANNTVRVLDFKPRSVAGSEKIELMDNTTIFEKYYEKK